MHYIAGIWRLLAAAAGVIAINAVIAIPSIWAHYAVQVTALTAFVMLWGAAASLIRGIHPPAWLKGAVVTYAILTITGAATVMPAGALAVPVRIAGLDASTLMYWVVPAMTILDFLVFDQHRRFRAVDVLVWLIYPAAYAAFSLARTWSGAHSSGVQDSPYALEFLNQSLLGWTGFGVSCLKVLAATLVAGVVVCLIDRAMSRQSLLHAD